MGKNIIVLDAPYKIGQIVEPIVNDLYDGDEGIYFTVIGYEIVGVTESGEVNSFLIKCQGQSSEVYYFYKESIRAK